jgi:L-methionine (R)-S-oxide reductase
MSVGIQWAVNVLDYSNAINQIHKIITQNKNNADSIQEIVDFLYKNFEKYSWVGIYLIKENNLLLGPWCGPSATEHTKIAVGFGICGSAAKTGKTEVIADVSRDTRYLSCFLSTRSEIVVPIKKQDVVVGEIDIDSDVAAAFTSLDVSFLESVAELLVKTNVL